MAKQLSKQDIVTRKVVKPGHVSQSVDAFTGIDAYDIIISGSLTITGSVAINGLTNTAQSNVLTVDTTTGQLYYTASSAIGGGGGFSNTGSFTGSFTGSLQGTASYATNTLSASYAATASYVNLVAGPNITINQVGTSFEISGSSGSGSTNPAGNNYEIQFNNSGNFGATGSFRFNYLSQSLEQGTEVTASGLYSHAEGGATIASGLTSHAEGAYTLAEGIADHAEGFQTTASSVGWYPGGGSATAAHAEGYGTKAYGIAAHAEGYSTMTSGNFAHAEGFGTLANQTGSHAEGFYTTASGIYSHAEGFYTIASGSYQHVQGQFNTHGDDASLMIVGNGTADNTRSDAFKVRMSGSIVLPTTQSATPSWTGTDGEMVFATVGGNHFFYVWMSGAWRSGSLS
jgi:hypothetical protein